MCFIRNCDSRLHPTSHPQHILWHFLYKLLAPSVYRLFILCTCPDPGHENIPGWLDGVVVTNHCCLPPRVYSIPYSLTVATLQVATEEFPIMVSSNCRHASKPLHLVHYQFHTLTSVFYATSSLDYWSTTLAYVIIWSWQWHLYTSLICKYDTTCR